MKKIILLAGGALLLIGAAVGGTLFFTGAFNKDATAAENAEGAVAESEAAKPPQPREVFYYNFQPEFVVNFGAKARPKFLMLEVVASTHDEKVLDVIEKHMPVIRNDLLLLFAAQDSTFLGSTEGKNELRQQTYEAISNALEKHYGPDAIEEVFLTRFVMQ
jgi:flagellar FliL protein